MKQVTGITEINRSNGKPGKSYYQLEKSDW